jgi:hypothetical protein
VVVRTSCPCCESQHGNKICTSNIQSRDDEPTYLAIEGGRLRTSETIDLVSLIVKQRSDPAQSAQRLLKIASPQLALECGILLTGKPVEDLSLQVGDIGKPASTRNTCAEKSADVPGASCEPCAETIGEFGDLVANHDAQAR